MNDYQTLRVKAGAAIATLTLNRPDCRNALNLRMCDELVQALQALAANESVRVVLIRANGSVFCAGADLKERQTMTTEELKARRLKGFAAYSAIQSMPKPTIALVHGAAIGSGCEIAGACDFILASAAASFRYPEVGWGTVGATQRLPRIVGARMAKELLFTGRKVDAEEARQLGIVNRVVPSDALEGVALAMAEAIAKSSPLAVRLTKRCIDEGLETTRDGALAIELEAIVENLHGSDWKAAIAGFGSAKDSDR